MQGLRARIAPLVSSSLEMVENCHCIHTCATACIQGDSGRATCMVYHGDTAFGEDIQHAGA